MSAQEDQMAVKIMAIRMERRMTQARLQGKSGWNDPNKCSTTYIAELLMKAVHNGDFVSVANYAMMLEMRKAPPYVLEVVAKHFLIDPLA